VKKWKQVEREVAKKLESEKNPVVIAALKKKLESYRCGIFVGGPLDGKPVRREMLKKNARYILMPGEFRKLSFALYEREKNTDRLNFIKMLEDYNALSSWQDEYPQEFYNSEGK
jgi:hypothetical protein